VDLDAAFLSGGLACHSPVVPAAQVGSVSAIMSQSCPNPNCGADDISPEAQNCPRCGVPLDGESSFEDASDDKDKPRFNLKEVLFLLLTLAAIFLIFDLPCILKTFLPEVYGPS
jgi:hypothetical protein